MRISALLLGLSLLVTACGNQPPPEGAPPAAIPSIDQSTGADFEVCPESGILIKEDGGDAAMGLRVLSFSLKNCGDTPQKFDGYPEIALYDAEGDPIEADLRHGSADVSPVESFDLPAEPFTLQPGERARAGILWRNLVDGFGSAATADSMAVTPRPGERPQYLTGVNVDLGTTTRVGVSPWKKHER